MKSTKFLLALLIAAGMFIACGGGEHKESASDTQTEQIAVVDTVHAYICPMNCIDSGSMEPGVCKVCGMDLVKNPNYKGTETSAVQDTTVNADTAAHSHDDHSGHKH